MAIEKEQDEKAEEPRAKEVFDRIGKATAGALQGIDGHPSVRILETIQLARKTVALDYIASAGERVQAAEEELKAKDPDTYAQLKPLFDQIHDQINQAAGAVTAL